MKSGGIDMKFVLKITLLLAGLAAAELPLNVRADMALSQLQANIQANNFAGALPWLEKAVALEAEGYRLPSGMGFYAGQVYAKSGEKAKAIPYLQAYVNQSTAGKNFWEAVQLLSVVSPSMGKTFLETYLAKNNPPYYQEAINLHASLTLELNEQQKLKQDEINRLEKERIDSLRREEEKAKIVREENDRKRVLSERSALMEKADQDARNEDIVNILIVVTAVVVTTGLAFYLIVN